MADYIYLLENRLAAAQRSALHIVREIARFKGLTSFLVGGAVRDLTSGSPVRDLDVVVQGNAPKLRRDLERAGAIVTGENDATQSLFLRFPGGVRLEIGSAISVHFPKPGKPVVRPAGLLEDLRRRDFTANAMALSLNEGSYGLLMDPLNGVADIENRELRLVSNYGFIEDPVRMIRAARLMARLGWSLDEKTQARYETGKAEGYISALTNFYRGYETEEIFHEEDPLRVLKRLEAEGWMAVLAPFWTAAKVNVPELERLRETQTMLQMQGLLPDGAAASFPLLTAKLSPKEIATLKASFPRQGFVAEVEGLEASAKEFAGQLSSKEAAAPSATWRILFAAAPEAVLSVAFSSKNAAIQAKLKSFATEWPQARTRMPYLLMQEMRIVPELPGYDDLLEKIFFELIDGRLTTPEETRAFLEPFSPPAPPPPVNLRRLRTAKKETKPSKAKSKKPAEEELPAAESTSDEEGSSAVAEQPAVERPTAEQPTAGRPVAQENVAPVKTPTVGKTPPVAAKAPAASSSSATKEAKAAAVGSEGVALSKAAPSRRAPSGEADAGKAPPARNGAPPARNGAPPARNGASPARNGASPASNEASSGAKAAAASSPARRPASPEAKVPVAVSAAITRPAARTSEAGRGAPAPASAKTVSAPTQASAPTQKNGQAKRVEAPQPKPASSKVPLRTRPSAKAAPAGKSPASRAVPEKSVSAKSLATAPAGGAGKIAKDRMKARAAEAGKGVSNAKRASAPAAKGQPAKRNASAGLKSLPAKQQKPRSLAKKSSTPVPPKARKPAGKAERVMGRAAHTKPGQAANSRAKSAGGSVSPGRAVADRTAARTPSPAGRRSR